jgi:hypothetical protein
MSSCEGGEQKNDIQSEDAQLCKCVHFDPYSHPVIQNPFY